MGRRDEAAPGRRTPGAKTSGNQAATSPLSLPCARTYAGPPCTGRRLWAAAVLTCPVCGGMHTHRVGETARLLAGRVVKACPVSGHPYRLAPVQRRKEARRG
jgi:hypothetical protein